MGESEIRALGAGARIDVDGITYELSPITMKSLALLQREALQAYKRQFLETYLRNIEMLGDRGNEILERKMDEAARWDLKDLPKKKAFSVQHLSVTSAAKKKLVELFSESAETEMGWQAMLTAALEREMITPAEVKELCGGFPQQGLVDYDMWWATATIEGVIAMVYESARQSQPSCTREEISNWNLTTLLAAGKMVELLTAPAVKNSSGPLPTKKLMRGKKKPSPSVATD